MNRHDEELQLLRSIAAPFLRIVDGENEGTAVPWWFIVPERNEKIFRKEVRNSDTSRMMVHVMSIVGPFFSRESAEQHRKARIYEYGEKSFVYCKSGHYAREYSDILTAAKQLKNLTEAAE